MNNSPNIFDVIAHYSNVPTNIKYKHNITAQLKYKDIQE